MSSVSLVWSPAAAPSPARAVIQALALCPHAVGHPGCQGIHLHEVDPIRQRAGFEALPQFGTLGQAQVCRLREQQVEIGVATGASAAARTEDLDHRTGDGRVDDVAHELVFFHAEGQRRQGGAVGAQGCSSVRATGPRRPLPAWPGSARMPVARCGCRSGLHPRRRGGQQSAQAVDFAARIWQACNLRGLCKSGAPCRTTCGANRASVVFFSAGERE